MKRFFMVLFWTIAVALVVAGLLLAGFIYKVTNGFPVSYETDVPQVDFPNGRKAVLLFSKSTGFRHAESIEEGKRVFADMAAKNDWFLYSTEEGGVFNKDQLSKFDVVIFNNSTGRLLNEEQQNAFREYIENGGSYMGIHGAGDNSHHHWPWYEETLIGSKFSHHTLKPQFQETEITLNTIPDSVLSEGLPAKWTHTDEWYVFTENPRQKAYEVVYTINGEKINPDGNLPWVKGKNFGMGKDHPVAWYKSVGKGRTFYTSMGHDASAWKQEAFVKMLENAVLGK